MVDILIDTIIDSLKIIPFLFVAFLIIELIEHKIKNQEIIKKSGKIGPLIGSILGAIPQCGFSVAATNLYVTRIISLGTLIAIYLSTSDEMLPIMLSEGTELDVILKILLIKVVIGIIFGFIIDLIFRKKDEMNVHICEDEHCDCDESIWKSTLKHTINIFAFIFIVNFILNIAMAYVGVDVLEKIFMKNSWFGSFIMSAIGLIPNCGASVVITELYLNNSISLGATLAGLLTGSGIAIIVLFRQNKNFLENCKILGLVYGIGAICGVIIDLLKITI